MRDYPLQSQLALGRRGPTSPAQNPLNNLSRLTQQNTPIPSGGTVDNPVQLSPLFGRPGWTYVGVNQAPRLGPLPRLSQGTGRTAPPFSPGGYEPVVPGYVTEPDYYPTGFTYQPQNQQDFTLRLPRTIKQGSNGRILVGTYEPHDFTPADRFFHQGRQAVNWQSMMYPPNFRNLLAWQQVQRYRIQSQTVSARPLDSSQYFLGYQINPQTMARSGIGQSTLGYMGSS